MLYGDWGRVGRGKENMVRLFAEWDLIFKNHVYPLIKTPMWLSS